MGKWTIDKQFDFCYGHRTHTQELIEGYSDNVCLTCRRIHGHQGHVHVFLESSHLNPQQMVVDFRNLGFFKRFLDDVFDHRTIIDINDPLINTIVTGTVVSDEGVLLTNGSILPFQEIKMEGVDMFIGYMLDTSTLSDLMKEFYESWVFVKFCPTSENLSKFMLEIVREKMSKVGVVVSRIDFFETPKSRASYTDS